MFQSRGRWRAAREFLGRCSKRTFDLSYSRWSRQTSERSGPSRASSADLVVARKYRLDRGGRRPERCVRLPWLALLPLGLAAFGTTADAGAALRFVHLSSDAPQVDVVLRDQALIRDVSFGDKTAYVDVPAGEHEIRVFPHRHPRRAAQGGEEGPLSAQNGLEPLTRRITLRDGGYYTLALVGFFEAPLGDSERGLIEIEVEPSGATVVLEGPRGYRALLSGGGELTGLEPGVYTVTAELEGYQPATYEVTVDDGPGTRLAMTLQEDSAEAAGRVGPAALTEAASSAPEWPTTELQFYDDASLALPDAAHALVRIVHASPVAGAVDVTIGESAYHKEAFEFPNASEYAAVPAGRHPVELVWTDQADDALRLSLTFEPGTVYTLYLVDTVDQSRVRLLSSVDAGVVRELE